MLILDIGNNSLASKKECEITYRKSLAHSVLICLISIICKNNINYFNSVKWFSVIHMQNKIVANLRQNNKTLPLESFLCKTLRLQF